MKNSSVVIHLRACNILVLKLHNHPLETFSIDLKFHSTTLLNTKLMQQLGNQAGWINIELVKRYIINTQKFTDMESYMELLCIESNLNCDRIKNTARFILSSAKSDSVYYCTYIYFKRTALKRSRYEWFLNQRYSLISMTVLSV